MPSPALKSDFVNLSTPLPNTLSATEYNLNATRTDVAYDNAIAAQADADTALALPRSPLLPRLRRAPEAPVSPVGAGFDCTAYTVDTSISAYTGQVTYPWDTGPGGTGAPRFRYSSVLNGFDQSAGWPTMNAATTLAFAVTNTDLECYVNGTDVTFRFYSYGDNDYKIMVDGCHLKQHQFENWPSGASSRYIHLTFATSKTRKIRILSGNVGFRAAYTPATGAIWPAESRARWLVTGDSWVHGSNATTEGLLRAGTFAGWLAVKAGVEVWNFAQGGTGYQNNASGTFGAQKYGGALRLAAYAAMTNVAGMIVVGGANDGNIVTYPVATTRTEAAALWTALKTYHPDAPLIIFGIESGPYPSIATDLNTLNTGLKAEALAHPGVDHYVDARATPWVSGTGRMDNRIGDGNADIFVCSDTAHPTKDGWEMHVDRFLADLEGVLV